MTWDNEGRLVAWQDAPSSPSSTDQYLYDGEGNRVEQRVSSGVVGGPTTTTVYVGALETVATSGRNTTTTTYYYAAGQRIALAVNGTLSYLANDHLGSATVALDASGILTASQLYAPYGTTRYASGTMPTEFGFTGQRADSATGLDYYGARYYDPALGQFTSADTVLAGGLNRYGYVKGNPETFTDPSGHVLIEEQELGEAGGEVDGGDGASGGDVITDTTGDPLLTGETADLTIETDQPGTSYYNTLRQEYENEQDTPTTTPTTTPPNEPNPPNTPNPPENPNPPQTPNTPNGNGDGNTGNGGNGGGGDSSNPNSWAQPNANQTRVGRWIRPQDLPSYRTGSIPQPIDPMYKGLYVGEPGFARPGGSGSLYIEFNVPTSTLYQTKDVWYIIVNQGLDIPMDGLVIP